MIKQLVDDLSTGLNIIDIGCRGSLDPKWKPIENLVNLNGFDPDAEECNRLAHVPNNFKSVNYHPYAIAGHSGSATLYKTQNEFCTSLLKPDAQWLRRFAFHEMFQILDEQSIKVVSLGDIKEFKDLDLDILKSDSQGLELEILKGAGGLLDRAIYVETESGFTPNYFNESTQAQVDEYMRSKDFLLFDLKLSRVQHDNIFKKVNRDCGLLLWSESVWLRDYISLHHKNCLIVGNNISREKAIKALIICSIQGCFDYGFELAKIFSELGLISDQELEGLTKADGWMLASADEVKSQNRLLNITLRLLPSSVRKHISNEASLAVNQRHVFSKLKSLTK